MHADTMTTTIPHSGRPQLHHAWREEREMSYNGWTNYETWNVNLWIDNEEPLYRAKQRVLRRAHKEITGDDVRAFFEQEMDGTTPDFDQIVHEGREGLDPVNFDEIAEHWEEERQEYV